MNAETSTKLERRSTDFFYSINEDFKEYTEKYRELLDNFMNFNNILRARVEFHNTPSYHKKFYSRCYRVIIHTKKGEWGDFVERELRFSFTHVIQRRNRKAIFKEAEAFFKELLDFQDERDYFQKLAIELA